MVVLNKIYTKTGDKGETALSDGTRVAKDSLRVEAYGTVDETNATVGTARLHAEGDVDAALARIQNDLFDLGADLSRPAPEKDAEAGYPVLRVVDAQVEQILGQVQGLFDRPLGRVQPIDDFLADAVVELRQNIAIDAVFPQAQDSRTNGVAHLLQKVSNISWMQGIKQGVEPLGIFNFHGHTHIRYPLGI